MYVLGIGVLSLFGKHVDQSIRSAAPPRNGKMFESAGSQLWLPLSFVGGDVAMNKAAVIQEIRVLGPKYVGMVAVAEEHPFNIWAVQPAAPHDPFVMNASVAHEYVSSDVSIDEYLDALYQHKPAEHFSLLAVISPHVEPTSKVGLCSAQSKKAVRSEL